MFSDLDECQSNSSNNCEQLCVNVPASFFFDCRDGFKLNVDGNSCQGKTCLVIDLHCLELYIAKILHRTVTNPIICFGSLIKGSLNKIK